MKKQLMYQAIIALLSLNVNGQINNPEIITHEKATSITSNAAVMNKNITLCNMGTDTLTCDQIKNCNELIITGESAREVRDYSLVLVHANGTDVYEYKGTGNKIPEKVIETIISSGTKKIFLEKVTISMGTESKDIGYRAYNIK